MVKLRGLNWDTTKTDKNVYSAMNYTGTFIPLSMLTRLVYYADTTRSSATAEISCVGQYAVQCDSTSLILLRIESSYTTPY